MRSIFTFSGITASFISTQISILRTYVAALRIVSPGIRMTRKKRQWKLRHSLKLCFTLYKKCHDDLHFRNRTSEVKGLVFRIMKELKITYLTKRELVKVFS